MSAGAQVIATVTPAEEAADRTQALDWGRVARDLDARGSAMLERLILPDECQALAALYPVDALFRSRVVMARHGFGRGEYKYFSYPLPEIVAVLRTTLYPHLAPIANRWNEAMGIDVRYPKSTRTSSRGATKPGKPSRPRSCCSMERMTITACIRMCTASTYSPYR
jgi:hypothetical protein